MLSFERLLKWVTSIFYFYFKSRKMTNSINCEMKISLINFSFKCLIGCALRVSHDVSVFHDISTIIVEIFLFLEILQMTLRANPILNKCNVRLWNDSTYFLDIINSNNTNTQWTISIESKFVSENSECSIFSIK